MDKELSRYYEISQRMQSGAEMSRKDIEFYLGYSPKIDATKIQKLADITNQNPADVQSAILEAGKSIESNPTYKAQVVEFAKDAEKGRLSSDVAQGIGLVLAGSDIAQSIQQLQVSKQQLAKSKRPAKPAVPGRDNLLASSLRQAQVDTNEAGQSLAPVQAQIADQYNADIANAKTASTGQAGAFGAYGQLAANRRNRAAMQLAPIADQVRQGQQARQDNLLGMRLAETQNQFDNNAQFYGQDMYQYNREQQAAAELGSQGRSNLRNSVYGLGQQIAPAVADYATERKYRNMQNKAAALYGPETADIMVNADKKIANEWGGLGADDTPIWQAY